MKKALAISLGVGSLLLAGTALAQGQPVQIIPPSEGINPYTPIGVILSNALTIIFVVAALAVLFMLIIGGFQWITSGGDKEKVGKARERITQALVGLAVLALAFLITVVVGRVVNIDLLNLKVIPALDSPVSETSAQKALREANDRCAKLTPPKVYDSATKGCI